MMTLKSLIFEKLKNGGLNKNDVVMLHSNIGPLFKFLKKQKYNFEVKDIAECIMEYFSSNGTLIIPTFNFEFCKGKSFSLKNTPSKMGVLSEEIRNLNKFNRTSHPVYSFVVIGNFQKNFIQIDNFEAFSKESPFGLMLGIGTKIVAWNLPDQNSMTFYHFIERENGVDYRFDKIFNGKYVDKKKEIKKKKYSVFVRDENKGVITDVSGMEKILWRENLFNGDPFDKGTMMIDRTHFRKWLSVRGADYKSLKEELVLENAIATPKSEKASMGKDTPVKLAQTYVMGLNLIHPRFQKNFYLYI